jgi:DNA-binding transcriptional MerR regulator
MLPVSITPYWTISHVADHFRVTTWKVRRCFERGLLPPAPRIGSYRIFRESDLPAIEAALRQLGYLPGGPHAA